MKMVMTNDINKVFDTLKSSVSSTNEYIDYLYPLMSLTVIEDRQDDYNVPIDSRWSEIIKNGQNLGERINNALKNLQNNNRSLKNVFNNVSYTEIDDSILHHLTLHINQIPKNKLGELA